MRSIAQLESELRRHEFDADQFERVGLNHLARYHEREARAVRRELRRLQPNRFRTYALVVGAVVCGVGAVAGLQFGQEHLVELGYALAFLVCVLALALDR